MKRVLLINQGKSENLGDKAIADTFKNVLMENECIVDFAGFSQTTDISMSNIKTDVNHNLKSKLKRNIPSVLVWLLKYKNSIKQEFYKVAGKKEYDLVIIGGGQLIKTKSVFPYVLLSWYSILRKHLDCQIVLAGIGVDTSYTLIEKILYGKLLKKFDAIYVRDYKSQKVLKDKFNIKATYIPDIVFSYSKYNYTVLDVEKKKILVMIFSYNSYINNTDEKISKEEYYKSWLNIIIDNLEPDLEVTLGYTTIGDKIETLEFANFLKTNAGFNFNVLDNDELISLTEHLKSTDKLISGRMHGMLLGLNYGCEIVPFVVSPKIETFKKEWIDSNYKIEEVSNDIDNSIKEILSLS